MNSKFEKFRKKVAFYLDDSDSSPGKVIDLALLAFNLAACGLFVLESYYPGEKYLWVRLADYFVASVFTLEYTFRVFSAKKRLKYIFSFYGIIDLLSIVPSILPSMRITQLAFLRVLKVLRILRFIRFIETADFFFGRISKLQLQVCRTLLTLFTILFMSAGFILAAESSAPKAVITTFGLAFYYSVITFSTVGFGDFVPVTDWGRAITTFMILSGWILIPWQTLLVVRILLSGKGREKDIVCGTCGFTGHDLDASHCKACGAVIFQKYEGEES